VRGLSRRRSVDVAVSGVLVAILGALAIGVALAPGGATRGREAAGAVADASADASAGAGAVPRVRVRGAGEEARLRIPYSDRVFQLSDERHVPDARDAPDPRQRAVVGGGPGLATVLACCSIGDAPATIALRDGRPPASTWSQAAETDLDLPSGHLAITTTDGLLAVAELPRGAYRLRVSGRGARELQQRRERFLIELWRR